MHTLARYLFKHVKALISVLAQKKLHCIPKAVTAWQWHRTCATGLCGTMNLGLHGTVSVMFSCNLTFSVILPKDLN